MTCKVLKVWTWDVGHMVSKEVCHRDAMDHRKRLQRLHKVNNQDKHGNPNVNINERGVNRNNKKKVKQKLKLLPR